MPLNIDTSAEQPLLRFEGIVAIEETDRLLELLQQHPGIPVDLSGCEHIHTALLQLLKILQVPVSTMPQDPFWRYFFATDVVKETETDEDNFTGR